MVSFLCLIWNNHFHLEEPARNVLRTQLKTLLISKIKDAKPKKLKADAASAPLLGEDEFIGEDEHIGPSSEQQPRFVPVFVPETAAHQGKLLRQTHRCIGLFWQSRMDIV